MLHTHCEQGSALESAYLKTTLQWVNAETRKRMAVAVSAGVGTEVWQEIARRATEARSSHDEALWTYIDHIVACPECHPANATVSTVAALCNDPDPTSLPEIVSGVRHRGSH